MYGCGLRVSEVAQVRLDDLRPEPNAILINGKDGPYAKNAKHRMVPLNPKSRGALDTYLVERERVANANKTKTRALFFRVRGKFADTKCAGGTLPINVLSIARCYCTSPSCAAYPPMHPHLLRHACATHILDNGCPST
jgi:site-specific recombinase XerD